MANMTIGAVLGETTSGKKSRLRKVTFTHTSVGTAAGAATTTFLITGRLLRFITTGGDAAWTFVLNDGTANIYTSASLDTTATSGALNTHATVPHSGIPMVGQYLTCTTAGVSNVGGGTAPTITIIWEESDTIR